MDPRLYRKALAEAADWGLASIRLGVTGEPLLRPDIDQWVREARAAGILDVSLITNGRLLTPELSRRLIEAGLTRLMIFVDSAGPETYARVRPGGDWKTLVDNIEAFRRARAGRPMPLLRISFVEMSVNQAERENFEAFFGPKADYLNFQNYLNIFGAKDTDFSPPQAKGSKTKGRFCAEPFTRMALYVDGSLFPCCSDFGRRKPIGHLDRDSLLSVWLCDQAEKLRREGAAGSEPCRSCLAGGSG